MPETLDPDRKVRSGLELITVEKSEFDRIVDMRPFARRRQRYLALSPRCHNDSINIRY